MKSKIRDLQILLQKEDLFGAKNFCEDFLRNQNIDDYVETIKFLIESKKLQIFTKSKYCMIIYLRYRFCRS